MYHYIHTLFVDMNANPKKMKSYIGIMTAALVECWFITKI